MVPRCPLHAWWWPELWAVCRSVYVGHLSEWLHPGGQRVQSSSNGSTHPPLWGGAHAGDTAGAPATLAVH
jgi:hypothetical protein